MTQAKQSVTHRKYLHQYFFLLPLVKTFNRNNTKHRSSMLYIFIWMSTYYQFDIIHHLSSRTVIISPALKVSSLSSAASKSYIARTFRPSCWWLVKRLDVLGYKVERVVDCCLWSFKDNSIAGKEWVKKTQLIYPTIQRRTKRYLKVKGILLNVEMEPGHILTYWIKRISSILFIHNWKFKE